MTEEMVPYGLLVWSTGIGPRPVVEHDRSGLLPKDPRSGRIQVDGSFRIQGYRDEFAIGDCALYMSPSGDGKPLPATAQVASQQGKWLAKGFNRDQVADFQYRHLGMLAYVGSHKALADLGAGIKSSGLLTWLFWRSAYLTNLVSIRNKILVPMYWLKTMLFGRDVSHF